MGESIFAHDLEELQTRFKGGERDKIRFTADKLWGGMAMFEGWCASEGFHSAP